MLDSVRLVYSLILSTPKKGDFISQKFKCCHVMCPIITNK